MEDEIITPEEEEAPEMPESFEAIDEQLAEHRDRVAAAKQAREDRKKSTPPGQ